jgi:hypothetical protein
MTGFSGRELTTEERNVQASLQGALGQPEWLSLATIRTLAAARPGEFMTAALSMLESKSDPSARRWLCQRLLQFPEFLQQLFHSDRLERTQLIEICRALKEADDFLDTRLARLASGREDSSRLTPEIVLRLLDVLHEISSGPRLVQMIGHLTRHPDERVASKAAMLIGHRLRNQNWVRVQLESGDPRVRASVVEGLWGVDTPANRKCLWDALKDENNRVAGNALLGLHMLREPATDKLVKQMLCEARPQFRRTAAWLMGKIARPEFAECLRQAQGDPDPGVRQAIKRALKVFQGLPAPAEAESVSSSPPAVVSPATEPASPPTKEEKSPESEEEAPFAVPHFDGRYIRGL